MIVVCTVMLLVMAEAVAADEPVGDVQEKGHVSHHNLESAAPCWQSMQWLARTAPLPGRP